MKLYHIIYITIFIYLLSACTNQEKQDSTILSPELQQVEAIMYQSPDSAFQLLQTIPVPPTSDSLQYATWALFTTQAKYKLYMKQSDSLINIAYPYFLRHGDAQRKALALYYKAVICKEQNKTEEAQRFCLEAAKEIDKTSDYSLSYLIYIEMADTYIYSDLKEYALETANKAYVSAQKSSEPRYVISSLIYLARINSSMGNLIKSTEYYKKTIDFAEKTNAYKTMASATTELIAIYSILKNNDAIRYYTRYYLTLQKKYNLIMDGSQYSVIGEAYQLLNQPDSAYYYLRQGLEVPSSYTNVYIKRALYYRLFHLAFDMLDYKSSAIYADKALIYNDSVNQADQSNALIEMQEKYNQQKLINERNELRIKKDRVTRNALMGLLIAACLIAILIYFYQRKLRKGEREIQEAKEEAKKKTIDILTKTGLPRVDRIVNEYPFQLSGGQRQRVMIAMALVCNPKILIADEPTTALDVTIQAQILDLMNQLKKDSGTSIIFITHDLGVVAEVCDEVVVMYCGRVVEKANVYDLFQNPSHPYTEGLLASIPKMGEQVDELESIPGNVPNPKYMPKGCKFAPRCKYAQDRCMEEEPTFYDVGGGHLSKCFRCQKQEGGSGHAG